ncbi:Na(+)-translocating NADH-quinone reductase subunit A [Litorivivens sp.]|uniref:Na(+)-translocating NADH-quinone reductase subunit A n=1 Tax=Litorivivens sp. TaxID=2020868 RepID=UPI00356625BB
MIKISKGLDLPITGAPAQQIDAGPKVRTVAVVGFDYVGMKPTMEVSVGDRVKTGQLLFTDKKTPGVRYTAPATGVISAINRGERRVLQSVVIDVEEDDYVDFGKVDAGQIGSLEESALRDKLVESGLWCALRTRPFSKTPALDAKAAAIFVNAMDTRPLAGDPQVVIGEYREDFVNGLAALSRLSGKVFVCKAPGADIPEAAGVTTEEFAGPHPAGLPGTHVHYLLGASSKQVAWTVDYQDVIAIGKLLTTGNLWTERVVALAGPQVDNPRLLRTRLGVHLEELVAGQVKAEDNRIISGSVLGGRTARGPVAYLGRYHTQVSVLKEGTEREFMGWLSPGTQKHSTLRIYLSQFAPKRLFNFNTNTNGSERAMVPVGVYENIMPLDILPTQLLRSLIVGDTQMAQSLGALELDEEDLALCTYVCPGKYEYGPILRENLTRIEHEG